MKKVGVLRFLGTNCDRDLFQAAEDCGMKAEWAWYEDQFDWKEYEALLVPGGFSYGDYLRSGALAAKAPAMKSVTEAAHKGVPVLGICNGFQILCESNLLPGTLVRNNTLRFIDKWSKLKRVGQSKSFVGDKVSEVTLPIAHGEGRYYVSGDESKRLFDQNQVWWTYDENPNGSVENIAGVMNENFNVAGLMPHPERAMHDWMGREDGRIFFETLL